jgi:hypothetical protein
MPIIILSADPPEAETPIAARIAETLGYQTLGRETLPEIAAGNALAEGRLADALDRSPSLWRRMPSGRWHHLLTLIEAEVLHRLKADNIVCWGLSAHLYAMGIAHALKVRLLADAPERARGLAEHEGITVKQAQRRIAGAQDRRQRWCREGFGQDETDPSLFDLVINLGQIDPHEAVETITGAVAYRRFQPTTYSTSCLADLALAARVRATLLASLTDVQVHARGDKVVVTSKAMKRERRKKAAAIKELAGAVEGVGFVEVHLINYVIRAAAESFR